MLIEVVQDYVMEMVPEAFQGRLFAFGNYRRAELGLWIRAIETGELPPSLLELVVAQF